MSCQVANSKGNDINCDNYPSGVHEGTGTTAFARTVARGSLAKDYLIAKLVPDDAVQKAIPEYEAGCRAGTGGGHLCFFLKFKP